MRLSGALYQSFLVCYLIFFIACNSGGSGGVSPGGAADLNITANPNRIDTGDTMLVRIDISRVDPQGVTLKVRVPLGLTYVEESAVILARSFERESIEVEEEQRSNLLERTEFDINPQNIETNTEFRFLVFFITPLSFGGEERGNLEFELLGESLVESGDIAIDADLDDPDLDNSIEFDIESPQFSVQDRVNVFVDG